MYNIFDNLLSRKAATLTQGAGAAAAASNTMIEGLDSPEYRKLYKQLGTRNNNKEVRQQI